MSSFLEHLKIKSRQESFVQLSTTIESPLDRGCAQFKSHSTTYEAFSLKMGTRSN
jgi:hypothetical protein